MHDGTDLCLALEDVLKLHSDKCHIEQLDSDTPNNASYADFFCLVCLHRMIRPMFSNVLKLIKMLTIWISHTQRGCKNSHLKAILGPFPLFINHCRMRLFLPLKSETLIITNENSNVQTMYICTIPDAKGITSFVAMLIRISQSQYYCKLCTETLKLCGRKAFCVAVLGVFKCIPNACEARRLDKRANTRLNMTPSVVLISVGWWNLFIE